VRRGEAQCRSLALDVRALGDSTIGELVCANPFPSRPLGFFNDGDGSRFRKSYFSQNPPFWTHGDLIEITRHRGVRLHGRSDGVLNIRGVRVGPAEIYGILQSMDEIVDAMAVERNERETPGDAQLILLVTLREGLTLTPELSKAIRSRLAERGSTALVPARCVQVSELPTTFNGKRSEAAARDVVNGREVRNLSALQNPAALDAIRDALNTDMETIGSRAFQERSRQGIHSEAELADGLQRTVSRRLGLPIGADDNLLEIGADSLTILMLVLEIEEFVGHELSFEAFFSAPTVNGLSKLLWHNADSGNGDRRTEHVQVRPATPDDIELVCRLLDKGFDSPRIALGDWRRLFEYGWIDNKPDIGFVLCVGARIVGFLGTIYSRRDLGSGRSKLVCNLTAWYVEPEYRGWGSFLLVAATRDTAVTYTSLTPAPVTTTMLQALGYVPMEKKRFFIPLLNVRTLKTGDLDFVYESEQLRDLLGEGDRTIFDDHASSDLLHVVVREGGDYCYLIMKRNIRRNWIPVSELLYCNNPRILVRHFERIKLAVLRRHRAIVFSADDRFVPATVKSVMNSRSDRFHNSQDRTSSKLDLLYSEHVLLPV
jgi:acetoacetyl-CoA synthetase